MEGQSPIPFTRDRRKEWLKAHDAEVRAKAIDEFADKMIIMMSGHKADILMIAEQLKEGGK